MATRVVAVAGTRGLKASASVAESAGHTTRTRSGAVEFDTARHALRLSITVYDGQCAGSADTGDVSDAALDRLVDSAAALATYVDEDAAAALPERDWLAWQADPIETFRPMRIGPADAAAAALGMEAGAQAAGDVTIESAGAAIGEDRIAMANSHGFTGAWSSSWASLWCSVVAGPQGERRSDAWSERRCDWRDLPGATTVGAMAARRALAQVGSRSISSRRCAVLFDPLMASSLLSEIVTGLSGPAQYRGASLLAGSVGKPIMADHLSLIEDPFVPRGLHSRPFDRDGIAGRRRAVVADGVVEGYFLGAYGARRLGMLPTGNGSGPGNLAFISRQTAPGDDREGMLRRLGRGLFVTELSGQGVDAMTGDYSRAAGGFWIESGRIVHPVSDIVIAGSLSDMLQGVVAVGADIERNGSIATGSALIDEMTISGGSDAA